MNGERVISLVLAVLSVLFLWMLRDFPPALTEDDIGPAVFPAILLSCLLILSLGQFFISLRNGDIKVTRLIDNRIQIVCFVLVVLYLIFIPVLGYMIITPLFLLIMTRLLQVKNWVIGISYMLGIYLGIWFFFEKVSGIPLPTGIL